MYSVDMHILKYWKIRFYIFYFLIFGKFNSDIPFKILARAAPMEYLKWLTIPGLGLCVTRLMVLAGSVFSEWPN